MHNALLIYRHPMSQNEGCSSYAPSTPFFHEAIRKSGRILPFDKMHVHMDIAFTNQFDTLICQFNRHIDSRVFNLLLVTNQSSPFQPLARCLV